MPYNAAKRAKVSFFTNNLFSAVITRTHIPTKHNLFFIIYFTFSLSPYGKKQNHLLFPPFLSPEIGKPEGKRSHKKFLFFFFFFHFLHPTAPRNRKKYHLPCFSKFRLKVPKNVDKDAQVSFSSNYLFSAVITHTITPTHTLSFFPTHNAKKKALDTCFLKLLFFIFTPSPYPRNTS